jgi:hypothetical protein
MEIVETFYNHWDFLRPFGIIYGRLVWFVVIWYIFPVLVCLDQQNLATLLSGSESLFYLARKNSEQKGGSATTCRLA